MKYITVKKEHIPNVKVGDILHEVIHADASTTLWNARKVTKIETDGTLRVECIDSKCKKKECTYLKLTEKELEKLTIDNTLRESKRLSGITM